MHAACQGNLRAALDLGDLRIANVPRAESEKYGSMIPEYSGYMFSYLGGFLAIFRAIPSKILSPISP